MAIPPPPYANIAGTSQIVAKYNEQETIAEVDGNAKPGQLIVDLTTDPPDLYIGNNAGNITLIASGADVSIGNYVFIGDSMYTNNSGYPHIYGGPSGGPELSYITDPGNTASYTQTMYINDLGLTVSTDSGNYVMNYSNVGVLSVPGNITGANVIEANTFASTTGNLFLTPNTSVMTSYVDIFLTGGPDIHIAGTSGDNLILGTDAGANVTVGAGGQISVQSYDIGNTATHAWTFGILGALQFPVVPYANLPAATTPGLRAFVNDSNLAASGNFGAQLTGSAGNTVPVFSDGTNWLIG